MRLAPGHIEALQNVVIEGGGKKLLYLADLIPTSRHIQPAWIMGYDLDVVTCVDEKSKYSMKSVTLVPSSCSSMTPMFPRAPFLKMQKENILLRQ